MLSSASFTLRSRYTFFCCKSHTMVSTHSRQTSSILRTLFHEFIPQVLLFSHLQFSVCLSADCWFLLLTEEWTWNGHKEYGCRFIWPNRRLSLVMSRGMLPHRLTCVQLLRTAVCCRAVWWSLRVLALHVSERGSAVRSAGQPTSLSVACRSSSPAVLRMPVETHGQDALCQDCAPTAVDTQTSHVGACGIDKGFPCFI